jgi:hypothetical protein
MFISEIIFKKLKKNYFDIFISKKHLKINYYHIFKYP